MQTRYETDVVAWAKEQAGFIRSGQFGMLDLEQLAQEIEDVGKSEQRELASRMAVLLAHLLKWQFRPSKRSKSWEFNRVMSPLTPPVGDNPNSRMKLLMLSPSSNSRLLVLTASVVTQASNRRGIAP